MLREHRGKACASRDWKKPKPTSITGNNAGPTPASTARPSGRWPPCLPKRNPRCFRFHWSPSAITSTANASCIWTAASRSKPLTTGHRRAGSDARSGCNGMTCMSACSIPRPGNCCANTCARSEDGIASRPRTAPSGRRCAPRNCCGGPVELDCISARSATPSIVRKAEVGVRRILGVLCLAKKYGTAAVDEACAAALEMGVQEYRFVRRYLERHPQAPLSLQQVDPLIRELVQYRDLIDYRTKEVEE